MSLNFLIAGVARCGTTSLFHYLNQHPEIGMSKVKEPKYFSSLDLALPQQGIGDNTVYARVIRSEKEYDGLFKGLGNFNCIGEGSSDCFYYHEAVIPRIKEKWGGVKIIVCLRNPVERSYSAYSNLVRDSREKLSFTEALEQEEDRISKNWDWMWHYKKGSLYADALAHYQREFTHVKVVFFEDLEQNPGKSLREVFKFLNVNEDVVIDVSTKYSQSGKPKNALVSALTSRNNPLVFRIREFALKTIPRTYLEKLSSRIYKKGTIDSPTKKKLKLYFKDDINKLEKLTQRDLSSWK